MLMRVYVQVPGGIPSVGRVICMMVNGVDMGRISATVGAIQENPEHGRITFKGITSWNEGAHSTALFRNFVIPADESADIGGTDRGPSPVELVLAALGACVTVGIAYSAASEGIELFSVELDVEGDIDLAGFLEVSGDVRPGFQDIRVTARVDAAASREKIQEIVHRANTRSPLTDMLIHPVPVRVCLAQEMAPVPE
jgi:uncharacterized OsmC-like protein